ncbi:MAG: hypothetical protein HRT38_02585 [Alteromonadaceae bacterium]|nr:hypothetical protein [Alteromonadaceae bacterium]
MSTLICRIELSKDEKEGITILVSHKDQKLQHHIQLNKESITITSENGADKSTIIQKPDAIKLDVGGKSQLMMDKEKINIKCSTFNLNADEIEIKSEGDINIKGGGDIALSADLNLTAKAEIEANFEGNMTKVSGSMVNIEGDLVTLG